MVKCKKCFIVILFTLFFAASCSADRSEEKIYYAPCQAESCAYIDRTIYFLLNNALYKFDEKKLCLEPACSTDSCVYEEHKNSISIKGDDETNEKVCAAAILPGGSVLGNNGNDLLAVNNNLYLEINKRIIYAGYDDGCIVYINEEKPQVEIFDIKKQQIISQFSLEIYEKGYTIACDNDYIYINHQGAYIEAMDGLRPENAFFVIDIYDYSGNLIQTVDLSKTVEHGLCAQYLCSTDKYIFIGEASYPLCRGLYVIEKESLKRGEIININELY